MLVAVFFFLITEMIIYINMFCIFIILKGEKGDAANMDPRQRANWKQCAWKRTDQTDNGKIQVGQIFYDPIRCRAPKEGSKLGNMLISVVRYSPVLKGKTKSDYTESLKHLCHGILVRYKITFQLRETENKSLLSKKTNETINNHKGTRMVTDGEN